MPKGMDSTKKGREAIVMGGSMAGLWTARVLADHFDHVTIVERDQLPSEPRHRPGVPQARQIHVLLRRGRLVDGMFGKKAVWQDIECAEKIER